MTLNYKSILNYFINRSTNASAKSFNAKIKAFRVQVRGVKNIEFFWIPGLRNLIKMIERIIMVK
ncbi:MAG: transposase [Gillisia sp.]|nr:transposase [Gillisia sp.]